ncbi:MAG: hypothetical protein IJI60_04630 [Bacilli bacterium]|nr:hypothetical protein [Bacilli bacterium]
MKKGNTCFLVARDRNTNNIERVFLDNETTSLEEIDLYTTSFKQKTALSSALYQRQKVKSLNNDFFIVYQTIDKQLQLWEVLYDKDKRIRPIARKSLVKNSFEQDANQLLNEFCQKMKENPTFYDMVMYKDTNLYPKFIRYFYEKRFEDCSFVKYKDGGWVRKSYPLLRNIVESITRFQENQDTYIEEKKERLKWIDKLWILTNDNALQPSFFDLLEERKEGSDYGYQKRKQM